MHGGHAFQTSEARRTGGFHADVTQLREGSTPEASPRSGSVSAPSEPPCSERAECATRPYEATSDTPPPASFSTSSAPEWCVDTGRELWTMTTFGLWEALERGRVTAWMRVWREGMECWTAVGELAEFTWALAATPEPADPVCAPEPQEAPEARETPSAPRAAEEDADDADTMRPPASGVRPTLTGSRGRRWIAVGSFVGAAAVVAALLVRPEAPPPPPEVASAGAAMGRSQSVLDETTLRPTRHAREASARHDERGQRRLPRGGRADGPDSSR
jgi:hypothetical protein